MKSYDKNSPETIRLMFDSIAKQYDRTNAILSFSMHKLWNRYLIERAIDPKQPQVLLDLCCGTGEIAFTYLAKTENPITAYMLDFSEGMLNCAKSKADCEILRKHDIHYLQADAQAVPLTAESVDCASIAYGIRNIKDPQKCFQEVARVLKPEGVFGILELTQPSNRLLRAGHNFYLRNLLPVIGKFAASNEDAYRYLCNSINSFTPPEQLAAMLKSTGFRKVERHPLMGGIATVLIAQK